MRAAFLLQLLALGACEAEEPARLLGPPTEVFLELRGFEPEQESRILDGAAAWAPLGYRFTVVDRVPDGEWHFAYIDAWSDLGGPCAAADRGRHHVKIDLACIERRTDWAPDALLQQCAAHELGHILLDTPEHTATGVMSGHSLSLSPDDLALACRATGRGC